MCPSHTPNTPFVLHHRHVLRSHLKAQRQCRTRRTHHNTVPDLFNQPRTTLTLLTVFLALLAPTASACSFSSSSPFDPLSVVGCSSVVVDNDPTFSAIPADAFSTSAATLTSIEILNCPVTTVSPNALAGLTHLESFKWTGSAVAELPDGLFADSPGLNSVILEDHSSLAAFGPGTFNASQSLQVISLASLPALTSLPATMFPLQPSLVVVSVVSTGLATLAPGFFSGVPNLIHLFLYGNSLTSLPSGLLHGQTRLSKLGLFDNALESLPPDLLVDAGALTELYLFDNPLPELPSLAALVELRILYAMRCELTSVPLFPSALSHLEDLRLSENNIESVPPGALQHLESVVTLDLSHNSIAALPAGMFTGTPMVTSLLLGANRLTSLPPNVFDPMAQLLVLRLDRNELRSLPHGLFSALHELLVVSVQQNSFHQNEDDPLVVAAQLLHTLDDSTAVIISHDCVLGEWLPDSESYGACGANPCSTLTLFDETRAVLRDPRVDTSISGPALPISCSGQTSRSRFCHEVTCDLAIVGGGAGWDPAGPRLIAGPNVTLPVQCPSNLCTGYYGVVEVGGESFSSSDVVTTSAWTGLDGIGLGVVHVSLPVSLPVNESAITVRVQSYAVDDSRSDFFAVLGSVIEFRLWMPRPNPCVWDFAAGDVLPASVDASSVTCTALNISSVIPFSSPLPGLESLTSVVDLTLSGPVVSNLTWASGLSLLQTLAVSDNPGLTSLPPDAGTLWPSLSAISIDSCPLATFPDTLTTASQPLSSLVLKSTDLTSLPALNLLTDLTTLLLPHNDLSAFPDWPSTVTRVALEGNTLYSVDGPEALVARLGLVSDATHDCVLTPYSDWSSCLVPCTLYRNQERSRTQLLPATGDDGTCPTTFTQQQPCYYGPCSLDLELVNKPQKYTSGHQYGFSVFCPSGHCDRVSYTFLGSSTTVSYSPSTTTFFDLPSIYRYRDLVTLSINVRAGVADRYVGSRILWGSPITYSWSYDSTPPDVTSTLVLGPVGSRSAELSLACANNEPCDFDITLDGASLGVVSSSETGDFAYWPPQSNTPLLEGLPRFWAVDANTSAELVLPLPGAPVDKVTTIVNLNPPVTELDATSITLRSGDFGPGLNTLFVQVTDGGGRPDPTPITYTVSVDREPPTLVLVHAPSNTTSTADGLTAKFVLDASDDLDYIDRIEYRLSSAETDPWRPVDGTLFSYHIPAHEFGQFAASFRAVDGAGRMSPVVSHTWEVEPAQPTITWTHDTDIVHRHLNDYFVTMSPCAGPEACNRYFVKHVSRDLFDDIVDDPDDPSNADASWVLATTLYVPLPAATYPSTNRVWAYAESEFRGAKSNVLSTTFYVALRPTVHEAQVYLPSPLLPGDPIALRVVARGHNLRNVSYSLIDTRSGSDAPAIHSHTEPIRSPAVHVRSLDREPVTWVGSVTPPTDGQFKVRVTVTDVDQWSATSNYFYSNPFTVESTATGSVYHRVSTGAVSTGVGLHGLPTNESPMFTVALDQSLPTELAEVEYFLTTDPMGVSQWLPVGSTLFQVGPLPTGVHELSLRSRLVGTPTWTVFANYTWEQLFVAQATASLTNLVEGPHIVQVRTSDLAGNRAEVQLLDFTTDVTPPVYTSSTNFASDEIIDDLRFSLGGTVVDLGNPGCVGCYLEIVVVDLRTSYPLERSRNTVNVLNSAGTVLTSVKFFQASKFRVIVTPYDRAGNPGLPRYRIVSVDTVPPTGTAISSQTAQYLPSRAANVVASVETEDFMGSPSQGRVTFEYTVIDPVTGATLVPWRLSDEPQYSPAQVWTTVRLTLPDPFGANNDTLATNNTANANATANVNATANATAAAVAAVAADAPLPSFYVRVRGKDLAGHVDPAVVPPGILLFIDTVPPSTASLYQNEATTKYTNFSATPTWLFRSSEASRDLVVHFAPATGSGPSRSLLALQSDEFYWRVELDGDDVSVDGSYTLFVAAKDLAGNVDPVGVSLPITVDRVPPVSVPVHPFTTLTVFRSTNVSIDILVDSVDTWVRVWVPGLVSDIHSPATTFAGQVVSLAFELPVEGVHDVHFDSVDRTGNVQTAVGHVMVQVDLHAPAIILTSAPEGWTPSRDATLCVAVGDASNTTVTVLNALDAGAVLAARTVVAGANEACLMMTLPVDGSASVVVSAVDAGGNVAVPIEHRWLVDTVAPVGEIEALSLAASPTDLDPVLVNGSMVSDPTKHGLCATGFDDPSVVVCSHPSLAQFGVQCSTGTTPSSPSSRCRLQWRVDVVTGIDRACAVEGAAAGGGGGGAGGGGSGAVMVVGDVHYTDWLESGGGVPVILQPTTVPDTLLRLVVTAEDEAGNTALLTPVEWFVDATEPPPPALQSVPSVVSSTLLTLQAVIEDLASPEAAQTRVWYTATRQSSGSSEDAALVGLAAVNPDGNTGPVSVEVSGLATVSEYQIKLFAVDLGGRVSPPATTSVFVAGSAPSVEVLSRPPTSTDQLTAAFVFRAVWPDGGGAGGVDSDVEPRATIQVRPDSSVAVGFEGVCDVMASEGRLCNCTGAVCEFDTRVSGPGNHLMTVRSELGGSEGEPLVVDWTVVDCGTSAFGVVDSSSGAVTCESCPSGADCTEGDRGSEIVALAGFWTPAGVSTAPTFYECPIASACLPGRGTCATGYTGLLCSQCDDGYFFQFGACVRCAGSGEAAIGVSLAIAVAVAVVVGLAYRFKDLLPLDLIKVFVSLFQILVASSSIFGIPWPTWFMEVTARLQVLMLDVSAMLQLSCTSPMGFFQKLLLLYVFFKVVLLVMVTGPWCWAQLAGRRAAARSGAQATPAAPAVLAGRLRGPRGGGGAGAGAGGGGGAGAGAGAGRGRGRGRGGRRARYSVVAVMHTVQDYVARINWPKVLKGVFLFLFLMYSATSIRTMQLWNCVEVEGRQVLVADTRIECYTSKWWSYAVYALFMTVVYVAGLPVLVLGVLLRHRSKLSYDAGVKERWGFLFQSYGLNAWWWECEELLRKLLLTAVVVLLPRGSATQLMFAVLVSVSAHVLHATFKPWTNDHPETYRLQHFSLFVTTVVFLIGLVLKVDTSLSSRSRNTFAVVTFLLVLAFFIVGLGLICLTVYRAHRRLARNAVKKSVGGGGASSLSTITGEGAGPKLQHRSRASRARAIGEAAASTTTASSSSSSASPPPSFLFSNPLRGGGVASSAPAPPPPTAPPSSKASPPAPRPPPTSLLSLSRMRRQSRRGAPPRRSVFQVQRTGRRKSSLSSPVEAAAAAAALSQDAIVAVPPPEEENSETNLIAADDK